MNERHGALLVLATARRDAAAVPKLLWADLLH